MEDHRPNRSPSGDDPLRSIADEVFSYLGKTFPVSCGSDEFHYFPQLPAAREGWSGWDDFTPGRIVEVKRRLSSFETAIDLLSRSMEDPEHRTDADTLVGMVRTLREQLHEVRSHESCPTVHLTILCTALASSLEDPDPAAWDLRAKTVPSFLSQAREALGDMPRLFRDQGLEMIGDVRGWLRSLRMEEARLAPVVSALERFEGFLRDARTRSRHLLPPETVEKIVGEHIGCGTGPEEVRDALLEELHETAGTMERVGGIRFPGKRRNEAIRVIPFPDIPGGGVLEMYRREAEKLLRHGIELGIVPEDLPAISPLRVAPLPSYLYAIRAASAYSFTPGTPSRGGTFYIVPHEGPWSDSREELVEYRMLTAHETYPGHHLLDSWRWHLVPPSRRPVERPLYYEGWACFAEELMRFTGYFSSPADHLLLAKRRYRRAVRGLVDLDLQTGRIGRDSAVGLLVDAGYPRDVAASVVPKYALRPGYQVCYSIGLRRFLDLHARYGAGKEKWFVRTVLSRGEIGFDRVEQALQGGVESSR